MGTSQAGRLPCLPLHASYSVPYPFLLATAPYPALLLL